MRILRARLLALAQEEADAEASDARRSQVRTVDRSERIRTYNFPENRITDHRVGYKAYNLDQVLDGDLDAVVAGAASTPTRPPAWPRSRAMTRDRPVSGATCARPRRRRAPAGRGRGGQPAAWTPSCCSRTCSASRGPAAAARTTSAAARPPRFDGAGRPSGPRGCRCSTSSGGAVPLPRARGRAGRVRAAAGDRARRRLAIRRAGRGRDRAARRRPVHRLGRDRAVDRPRGPGATVHAVELDPDALAWAAAQRATSPAARRSTEVHVHGRRRRGAAASCDGTVDVVVCNPPYMPDGAVPRDPEVRDHDPPLALWGGAGRPRRRARRRAVRAPRCCAPAAGSSSSTPTRRASARGARVPALLRATGCYRGRRPRGPGRPRPLAWPAAPRPRARPVFRRRDP